MKGDKAGLYLSRYYPLRQRDEQYEKELKMAYEEKDVYANDTSYKDIMNRPDAFSREDESDDREFYKRDRMVEHLDSTALETVEKLIGHLTIEDRPAILDLMASIDSHLPKNLNPSRVVGLGLNENELKANPILDKYIIQDINKNPKLPFEDQSFEIVINTVSIQYLTKPKEIFDEVARILKPGGMHLVIFSNRTFAPKAVKYWELLTFDERIKIVMDYFQYTEMFEKPEVFISMGQPRPENDKYAYTGFPSDPIFAVYADKKGADKSRANRPRPQDYRNDLEPEIIKQRKAHINETHECPYCGEKMRLWGITDNPMSTWDHDIYICVNDSCPYLVRGWKVMYEQGNPSVSYRLTYDPKSNTLSPIPVPNLAVIKDALKD